LSAAHLAGSVRWAVVPYAPAAPFELYAGADHAPIEAPLKAMIERGADSEWRFLVGGKVRPVLVLADPSEHYDELVALRLRRFAKLSTEEQQTVRDQRDPLMFHLVPERFTLPEENAVIVSAMVRVATSAIDTKRSLGTLGDEEMRVLGERVIRYFGFDTRLLVERRIRELAEARRASQER
jgi:hypothetical protein